MYGHICIKKDGCTAIYKANDIECIYNELIRLGLSHEQAEDIAGWSELVATIGDEYYGLDDESIEIWVEE